MVNLLYFLILFLFLLLLTMRLRKETRRNFEQENSIFELVTEKLQYVQEQKNELRQKNTLLEKTVNDQVELFDISKEICKHLEEEKVFLSFKKLTSQYLTLEDCRFTKSKPDAHTLEGYNVSALLVDKHPVGYLAVKGVNTSNIYRFSVLSQQLFLSVKRAYLYQQVQLLSVTDSLTQVPNRRYFMARLLEEIERSAKFNYQFSFLMIDLDNFKSFNDRYGHLVGDTILREAAKGIEENTRQIDLVGRYGGEEFSVILPETDKNQAMFAAERIRKAAEDKIVKVYDEELQFTLSVGMATFPSDGRTMHTIIDKADQALYRAKLSGKNKSSA